MQNKVNNSHIFLSLTYPPDEHICTLKFSTGRKEDDQRPALTTGREKSL